MWQAVIKHIIRIEHQATARLAQQPSRGGAIKRYNIYIYYRSRCTKGSEDILELDQA